MTRKTLAMLALALTAFAPSAWADANRDQTVASAQSAIDAAKGRWDSASQSLRAAVSDLSGRWDTSSSAAGWSADDMAALAAAAPSATDFPAFKSRLLAEFADLNSRIASQRAATAVSLGNLQDEVSLTYVSLTDVQKAAYASRVETLSAADLTAVTAVNAEIARLKTRYLDLLSSSYSTAAKAMADNAAAVSAGKASFSAWNQARDAYPRLAAAASKFTAADQDAARAAFVALSDAKDKVVVKIRSNLSDGIANAVKQAPRLSAVRGDLDAYVALKVSEISGRLSGMYSDADKRFFALSKAKALLDAQTGSLARAYDANGNFLWSAWSSTGTLAVAVSVRDDVVTTEATLASVGTATGTASLTPDRAAELQAFYVAEINAARSAVDAFVRAKADKLSAEFNRISQLVSLRATALQSELNSLPKFSAQRARIAQFASEVSALAEGNEEWPAKADALAAQYRAQQDATETGVLKVRLAAKAAKLEGQVNAALKGVVDRAVAAGTADKVVARFKEVRAKIPALLDRDVSDVSRYALLYITSQIDVFVQKVEG